MKMELDSSQMCTGKGKRQWPQVAAREIQITLKEKLSPGEWCSPGTGPRGAEGSPSSEISKT